MKKIKLIALLMVIALGVSSCSQRLIDFTVISSKNVSFNIDKAKGKKVKQSDMGFIGIGANIKDAMDKALESAGPNFDILVDGVVSIKQYPFWAGYVVEGTALSSKDMIASMGEEEFNKWYASANVFQSTETATQE